MTGSLIHIAFDPQPYVIFSICSVAIGVLLELGWTGDSSHSFIGCFQRGVPSHGLRAGDPAEWHPVEIAKR